MRRLLRRPKKVLFVGLSLWVIAGIIIVLLEPGLWWVELAVGMLVISGVYVVLKWAHLDKFWLIVLPIWIGGILLANRFAALDILTLGVAIGLLGLLALARGRL